MFSLGEIEIPGMELSNTFEISRILIWNLYESLELYAQKLRQSLHMAPLQLLPISCWSQQLAPPQSHALLPQYCCHLGPQTSNDRRMRAETNQSPASAMEFQQHWTPPSKYQQAFKHYCPATAATTCHKEKLCRVSRDAFGFDVVTPVTSVSSVISITLVTSVAPCVSVNQAVLARRANRPASLASWQSQFKQCTSQLGFLSFPNRFTWDRVGPCGNLVIHGTLLQRAFCKQAAGWKTVPGIKFCIKHCFRYSFLKDLLY